MSDEQPRQNTAPSREFLPGVKPLEDRCLLSSAGSFGFSPLFHILPRTGGVSAQTGSMLAIGVGQPTTNTVQVTDDGKGDIQAEWNGGPVTLLHDRREYRHPGGAGQDQSDHVQPDQSPDRPCCHRGRLARDRGRSQLARGRSRPPNLTSPGRAGPPSRADRS